MRKMTKQVSTFGEEVSLEYCLVEDWHNDLSFPNDCIYVALTIGASYQLDRYGIKYITFEDFYSKGEICSDADSYRDSQLEWFKEFDDFVKNIYPKSRQLELNLPSLYYFNILSLVDEVVLSSRIIKRFIDYTNPSKIWFVTKAFSGEKIWRWLWFCYSESVFSRMIIPICEERKIPVEKIVLKEDPDSNSEISHEKFFGKNIPLGKKLIKLSKKLLPSRIKVLARDVRELYLQVRCCCIWQFNRKPNKGNLLIIKGVDYIYDFAKDANRYGFNLLFKSGKCIRKQQFPLPWVKKIHSNKKHEEPVLGEDIDPDAVMDNICNGKIVSWINKECGFDVAPIVASRFRYLIFDVFPKTISLIEKFDELYTELEIDCVINYSLSSEEDFAAAAAARINNRTKNVGFYHGMDAYELKRRFFMESCHFDLWFSSTEREVENIRKLSKSFGYSHPIVNEYPYLRDRRKRIGMKKRKNERVPLSKLPTVLYVPIRRSTCSSGSMAIEKSFGSTMAYLKWHHSVIEYFSSRRDFNFVWKAVEMLPFESDTIPSILEDKGCVNISYSTTNFLEWLPKVDRVICDIPSTAFFEACLAGLPVMTLYNPADSILWETACDTFGNSLRPYSSTSEGIEIIEEFLNGVPGKHIVSLPENDTSVMDVLNSFLDLPGRV